MNPAVIDDMSWAMAEVYGAVTDRILINLAHHFKYVQAKGEITGSFEYQAKMLAQMGQVNKETIAIMAQSLGGADDALKAALETAIFEALKTEEPKLRKAAEKGLLRVGVPELSPNQLQAFRAYYRQSADKLNLVNTVMLESTQNAYMATVSDVVQKINRSQSILNTATGEVVTGVSSWNQALHGAVQKMVSNGLTGFIDHGGHKWSPEAYVAMDIRTTMFNTSRAAIWERSEQYGNDLYQVSSHQGARPLCYPWQGKIISTSGRIGIAHDLDGDDFPIHSESEIESFKYGGGLFGVNCGHYPMVFIDGVSTLKGEPQDPEDNAKTYAESQQQRALERKLREEKRDLEVMKAQGASPQEIAAQRERVRQASADIDQFCQDTGRARKKSREYTPVNAEFPEAPKTSTLREAPVPTAEKAIATHVAPAPVAPPVVETKPKFVPAKTIEEAEEFAQQFTDKNTFGAVGVSYQGVSVEVANVVNETLSDFYETYDVKKFGGIVAPAGNTKLGKLVDGAVAGYSPPRHSFVLNRKTLKTIKTANEHFRQEQEVITDYLKNPDKYSIKSAAAKRIFDASRVSGRATVPTNVQETLWHELGHSLESGLRKTQYYDKVKQGFGVYAERISGYATSSIDEYIAESFCAMKKGESIDPILATAFESLKR